MFDQSSIDQNLLDILAPPSEFPPSQQSLLNQLQNHFLNQCQYFLQKQKHLYTYSHKIEKKLNRIKQNLSNLDDKISKKGSQKKIDSNNDKNKQYSEQSQFERMLKQLNRINENQIKFQQRQQLLEILCKHLKMEKFRQILLTQKKSLQLQKEQTYLLCIQELRERLQQSAKITPQKYQSLPLIESMRKQFKQIYKIAIQKVLNNYLTPTMFDLLLKKYSHVFFASKQYLSQFYDALVKNRDQYFKLGLVPLINTLNYAHNVCEIYEKIVQKWIQMLKIQCQRFKKSNIQAWSEKHQKKENQQEDLENNKIQAYEFPYMKIIQTVCSKTLTQLLPILERNIYKVKQLQDMTKIRSQLQKLRFFLKYYINQQENIYQNLDIIIDKVSIFLQEKLKDQAEQLQNSKYNIYSLSSYLPIRNHLQTIKQCIKIKQISIYQQKQRIQQFKFKTRTEKQQVKQQKFQRQRENHAEEIIQKKQQDLNQQQLIFQQIKEDQIGVSSKQIEKSKQYKEIPSQSFKDNIDWQIAIKKLTQSRNPKNNPNNKSLIIFNLNTWFLYSKILKQGNLILNAQQTIQWSKNRFIQINIIQINKLYFNKNNFQKIIQNFIDLPSLKSNLLSQIIIQRFYTHN